MKRYIPPKPTATALANASAFVSGARLCNGASELYEYMMSPEVQDQLTRDSLEALAAAGHRGRASGTGRRLAGSMPAQREAPRTHYPTDPAPAERPPARFAGTTPFHLSQGVVMTESGDLRGQLTTSADIRRFVEAGNATLTLVSKKTGTRFTFRFARPDPDDTAPGTPRPIWVNLLNGPDNVSDYTFMGSFWPQSPAGYEYRRSAKVRVAADAPSMKALIYFMRVIEVQARFDIANLEVWHEGRCGRCGRKLTVPASIESGFGPECINHV